AVGAGSSTIHSCPPALAAPAKADRLTRRNDAGFPRSTAQRVLPWAHGQAANRAGNADGPGRADDLRGVPRPGTAPLRPDAPLRPAAPRRDALHHPAPDHGTVVQTGDPRT